MKLLLTSIALLGLVSGTAHAQHSGAIEKVRSGHSCPNCNLFQANLSYKDIANVNLSGSRLRQSDLSLSTMNGANFSGADLSISNLFGARFTGASFKNANLERSVLVGAYFGGANFAGANLTGVNFGGAELHLAKGLTQAQLDTTCGDEATTLPPHLRIPSCKKLQPLNARNQ